MTNGMAWAALGSGIVVAAGIGLVALGNSRWRVATQAQMAQLEAARLPVSSGRYDARAIDNLPAPVQRYFRAALKDGQLLCMASGKGYWITLLAPTLWSLFGVQAAFLFRILPDVGLGVAALVAVVLAA